MIPAILTGGSLGLAICFLVWTLLPARVDHVAVLGRIEAARATTAPPSDAAAPPQSSRRLIELRARVGSGPAPC